MEIIIVSVVVAAIIGFVVYGLYINKKRKDAVWTGVVVDKDISENVYDGNDFGNNNRQNGIGLFSIGNTNNQVAVTHSYSIKVKTDGGGQIDWDISSGLYETINIGDRLTKSAGTDVPEVIEKVAVSPPIAQPQQDTPKNVPPTGPLPPLPPQA